MIEAGVLHGHSEGGLQMSSALDTVMCLLDTHVAISRGQLDIQVYGDIQVYSVLGPVGLAIE